MLFQIISECFAYGLIDRTAHFVVAQLRLGLSFKLGFGHFHGNNGNQSFAEVLTGDFNLGFFQLFGASVFGIFLQHTGQCRAETGLVRTAFLGVDVVDVGMQVFPIACVIHHGAFDGHARLLGIQINDIIEKRRVIAVQVTNEFFHALFRMEYLAHKLTVLVFLPTICQRDANTCIQVG